MAILHDNIVNFAAGQPKPYEAMRDYYFHYMDTTKGRKLGAYDASVSFADKEVKMNGMLMDEVKRVSGVTIPDNISEVYFANNPMIRWATMAVVDMMIEAILPETIIDTIGIYTDIRNIGWGDSANFEIKPRALMTVSAGGNAQRTSFIQKQFSKNVTLLASNHAITVQSSLYKVLCGKESLAEFVRKAVISMETAMTTDAYAAFDAGLAALYTGTDLNVTGYTQDDLLTMCQTVQAYNQNAKPVIIGTALALSKILPNSAAGYRINTNSESMTIQLIRNFFQYDILELPQVATGNYADYGLALNDNHIYVVSPSVDKLLKGVIEGGVTSNGNDYYDNANLTSNTTLNKRWGFEYASNATAGIMTLA